MPITPPKFSARLEGWARSLEKRQGWVRVILFLSVTCTFLVAGNYDFINYDDDFLLPMNPHLQNGLADSVRWAFGMILGNWHPVTLLSHVLNYYLFGLQPWGHHLSNVLWHAANATLLYMLLFRMTRAMWPSLLVAALFGLHPLRAESVAWIAARTDVIGTFFWLFAIFAYFGYTEQSTRWSKRGLLFYAAAMVCFFLTLASKPMHVTLPCVLLLFDFWPLQRWPKFSWRILFIEKTPFFLMSIGACFLAVIARKEANSITTIGGTGLSLRVENAVISYVRYLGKIFYPIDLTMHYPYPVGWPWPIVLGATALLLAITIAVIVLGRKARYLPIGWFLFLGVLTPVIGFIRVGQPAMADRYSYAPSIGILIMIAWGLKDWLSRRPQFRAAVLVVVCIVLITLAGLTLRQLSYWKSSETLWRRSLAMNPDNYFASLKLADYLADNGPFDEAEKYYRNALKFSPGDPGTHNNLGLLLQSEGRETEAVSEFTLALENHPDYAEAHLNLGALLTNLGRATEADQHFKRAQELAPADASTWNNMGVALASRGRLDEAIKSFQLALRIDARDASAWVNLGFAFEQKNRRGEAIKAYEAALKHDPDSALAKKHLAEILGQDAGVKK